jgi:hypothetical protein
MKKKNHLKPTPRLTHDRMTTIRTPLWLVRDMLQNTDFAVGRCVNPHCGNPHDVHFGSSTLDQGGGSHVGAMTLCPCGLDTCLLKEGCNGLVCLDCVVTCDANASPLCDKDWLLCSKAALVECPRCKKRHCNPAVQFFGSGCLCCSNECDCDSDEEEEEDEKEESSNLLDKRLLQGEQTVYKYHKANHFK